MVVKAGCHAILDTDEFSNLAAGVLRAAIRRRDAGTLPAPALPSAPPAALNAAQAEALAVATSHPTWMVARWAARYGPADTMALLQANNRCCCRHGNSCNGNRQH